MKAYYKIKRLLSPEEINIMLKSRRVFMKVKVNEDFKIIEELISYGNDSGGQSKYRMYAWTLDFLSGSVISESIYPSYTYSLMSQEGQLCDSVDIKRRYQDILSFSDAIGEIMEINQLACKECQMGSYYELYVSAEAESFYEFGDTLETDFLRRLLSCKGYYEPKVTIA